MATELDDHVSTDTNVRSNNNTTTTSLPMHRTPATISTSANTTTTTTNNNHSSNSSAQQLQQRFNYRIMKNGSHIRRAFTVRICPTRIQNRLNRIFTPYFNNIEIPDSIRHFQCTKQHIVDVIVDVSSNILEVFIYCIGPLLILLALSIVGLLSYTFFMILLPMIYHKHHDTKSPFILYTIIVLHCSFVILLITNILYNYACCVVQKHDGHHYDSVVYELASITNVKLPVTLQEIAIYRRELYEKLSSRMKEYRSNNIPNQHVTTKSTDSNNINNNEITRRPTTTNHKSIDPLSIQANSTSLSQQSESSHTGTNDALAMQQNTITVPTGASSTTSTSNGGPVPRAWMLLGPYEWGFCSNTQQAKPPRAHYDHVTKLLILNLDHYCPWMFNAVGYFNYRYFVNFLIFTFVGMFYGAIIMYEPFFLLKSPDYRHQQVMVKQLQQHIQNESSFKSLQQQLVSGRNLVQRIRPMMPYREEKIYLTLSFMLCVAVGVALIGLGGFHMYLVSTGQTTIEFHGNWSLRRRFNALNKSSSGKRNRKKWQNPYSRGTILANWQQVYGVSTCPLLKWIGCGSLDNSYINLFFCILLPNRRLPEYLPFPIPGQNTQRAIHTIQKISNDIDEVPLNNCNVGSIMKEWPDDGDSLV